MSNKEINLKRGIKVSSEDDDLLNSNKWTVTSDGYAGRTTREHRTVFMHRTILERILNRAMVPGEYVDHINGIRLDNRRENLRVASHGQNATNSKGRAVSGYKGVTTTRYSYLARICKDREVHYLGRFETPAEAHEAYKTAARKYHGEFARFE